MSVLVKEQLITKKLIENETFWYHLRQILIRKTVRRTGYISAVHIISVTP